MTTELDEGKKNPCLMTPSGDAMSDEVVDDYGLKKRTKILNRLSVGPQVSRSDRPVHDTHKLVDRHPSCRGADSR